MSDYSKSKAALVRMRSKIFSYSGEKEEQADRVLAYLKQRKMRAVRNGCAAEPVGPYSGLTRRELRATGTCETDWY